MLLVLWNLHKYSFTPGKVHLSLSLYKALVVYELSVCFIYLDSAHEQCLTNIPSSQCSTNSLMFQARVKTLSDVSRECARAGECHIPELLSIIYPSW